MRKPELKKANKMPCPDPEGCPRACECIIDRLENDRLKRAIEKYGNGNDFDWNVLKELDELREENKRLQQCYRTIYEQLHGIPLDDVSGCGEGDTLQICCEKMKKLEAEVDFLKSENARLEEILEESEQYHQGWIEGQRAHADLTEDIIYKPLREENDQLRERIAALEQEKENEQDLLQQNQRLREAVQEALWDAEQRWATHKNHPASSHARDVAYYKQALEKGGE